VLYLVGGNLLGFRRLATAVATDAIYTAWRVSSHLTYGLGGTSPPIPAHRFATHDTTVNYYCYGYVSLPPILLHTWQLIHQQPSYSNSLSTLQATVWWSHISLGSL